MQEVSEKKIKESSLTDLVSSQASSSVSIEQESVDFKDNSLSDSDILNNKAYVLTELNWLSSS
jgi:hypothetical protein